MKTKTAWSSKGLGYWPHKPEIASSNLLQAIKKQYETHKNRNEDIDL